MYPARKYAYRRTLPHIQKSGRTLFVTFTTHQRWAMPESARRVALQQILRQRNRMFVLHAAVVMPDHVHMIYSPLRDEVGWEYSIPQIMHAVKGASARFINQELGRRGAVWQDECFDHVLRGDESLKEKIEYVCENPVRVGLVPQASEYPWMWCEDLTEQGG